MIQSWNWRPGELEERRKKLEEVDKLLSTKSPEDVFTEQDLENIVSRHQKFNSRIIITDRPGIGKTTAIRQYFIKKLNEFEYYGLYCTFLANDAIEFYKDIISLLPEESRNKVIIYTNDYKNFDNLDELDKASLIICTHMRLFINPPYFIFKLPVDNAILAAIGTNFSAMDEYIESTFRKDIFIDEIPTNIYLLLDRQKQMKLRQFNYYAYENLPKYKRTVDSGKRSKSELSYISSVIRNNTINKIYDNYEYIIKEKRKLDRNALSSYDNKNLPIKIGMEEGQSPCDLVLLMDNLPTNTNAKFETSVKRGLNTELSKIYKENTKYFADLYTQKMQENPENTYQIYSFDDFICRRMVFFSGTGDLLVNNSDYYQLDNASHSRVINIDELSLVHTNCTRNNPRVAEEYADLVNQIMNKNPGKRVLLYTYKSSYSNNKINIPDESELGNLENLSNNYNELDELGIGQLGKDILKNLPEDKKSLLDIIHYQSGKETVTSKFSSDDIIVILGTWWLPTNVVAVRSSIFHDNKLPDQSIEDFLKINQANYTLHLMIQCLYRTVARVDIEHPIKIYMDDQYGVDFRNKFIKSVNPTNKNLRFDENNKIIPTEDYTKPKYDEEEIRKIVERIISVSNKVDEETYEVDSTVLYPALIGNGKTDNSKIKRKLDKYNIKYKYIEGTRGGDGNSRNPSRFVVFLNK